MGGGNHTNLVLVMKALREFGAPLGDLVARDLEVPGTGFKMGIPPRRIDVLTQIEGLDFEQAWPNRLQASSRRYSRAPVIGLHDLITNKRAAGRPQDLADVAALERLARTSG
jgi:hypothetical protein